MGEKKRPEGVWAITGVSGGALGESGLAPSWLKPG